MADENKNMVIRGRIQNGVVVLNSVVVAVPHDGIELRADENGRGGLWPHRSNMNVESGIATIRGSMIGN